jgi:monoamine oxidase
MHFNIFRDFSLIPSLILTGVYGAAHVQSPTSVDVVVVGAGFSGLMSAYELQKVGLSAVVLEARDRIGGRSYSYQLGSGPAVVELGATWINNVTQPEVFKLTQEFGLDTMEQYTEGFAIFQGSTGQVERIPGNATTNVSQLRLRFE